MILLSPLLMLLLNSASFKAAQELPIINRGLEEAALMMLPAHKQSELLTKPLPKVRKVRKGKAKVKANVKSVQPTSKGGFASSASGPQSPLAKPLHVAGVVRIPSLLSIPLADSLRAHCLSVADGADPDLSNVLLTVNRSDVRLPLSDPSVLSALDAVLNGPLGDLLDDVLTTSSVLHELACLISDPGSQRQVLHPDVGYTTDLGIVTCFVALQNINLNMGPTIFLPGTHKQGWKELLDDEDSRDDMITGRPSSLSLLNLGEVSIFDGRILHAGSANESEERRAIFYFSFRSPYFNPASGTSQGSLCKELREEGLTLEEVRVKCAIKSS
ncbi:hypothetical protein TrLO_g4767 [Triparma laevis f. longispina]|uniref:Fe2OG dioxygenase domain-containing protein n=1 Tax=Triparma laevis f. longispina TaxID=1714387 RepID=A0A9W7DUJ0_9STRA|nr:hypothetical protein TrLO_g4767 [Triparma laevis f. longispina]